jgi:hypothetical protein
MKLLAVAACAAVFASTGTDAATTAATRPRTAAPAPVKKAAPDPAEVMAGMMKFMDLMFPAGPEPEPARLALARQATMTIFPTGTYAQAMNGFIDRTVERVLGMSEADFAGMFPPPPKKKGAAAKRPSTEPLRVSLSRDDASFDAKVAAGKAFMQTTLVKFGNVAEPRLREGMARALARRFDARQLGEIQAFLATPTGAAYGREMVGLWFEPDVMRGTVEALPEMMRLMPEVAESGAALEAQMQGADKKK